MLMQTLRSGQLSSVIGLVCVKLFVMKDIQVHDTIVYSLQ